MSLYSVDAVSFMSNYNKLTCEVLVYDSFGGEGALNASMSLTVLIEGVNDNAPEIESPLLDNNELTFEVREGEWTRGLIITKLRIFDKDDATGLQCLFANGLRNLEPFELRMSRDSDDPLHTAWCVLKVGDTMQVNYDVLRRDLYLLDIVVLDEQPQPPVYPNPGRANVQVKLKVISVNKHAPMFLNGEKETFYVLDSLRPDTLIGTISATDVENPNPDRIIYQLVEDAQSSNVSELFELKQYKATKEGKHWGSVGLVSKARLSAKDSPYVLAVTAYDGPPELSDTLSSHKIITVVVLNKGSMSVWSDATSGLPLDYYACDVREDVAPGTLVTRLQARLADLNRNTQQQQQQMTGSNMVNDDDKIRYRIVDADEQPYYVIDELTGEIRTTGGESGARLDFEERDGQRVRLMRNIRVSATSADGFFTYATHVSVNVVDTNDNAPVFAALGSIAELSVVENQTDASSIFVARVQALDADSGDFGLVEYALAENNTAEMARLFDVNKHTGELTLVEPDSLDRERNETLRLTVVAYDNRGKANESNSALLELVIRVLDINDNPPVFDPQQVCFTHIFFMIIQCKFY